jgi:hypothetical protein
VRKFLGIEHNGKGYCGTFNTATDFVLENGPDVIRSTSMKPEERTKIQKQYVDRGIEKLPHIPLKTSQVVMWHVKQKVRFPWLAASVIAAAAIGTALFLAL